MDSWPTGEVPFGFDNPASRVPKWPAWWPLGEDRSRRQTDGGGVRGLIGLQPPHVGASDGASALISEAVMSKVVAPSTEARIPLDLPAALCTAVCTRSAFALPVNSLS